MITSYREGPLLPIEHVELASSVREISISAPPGAVFDPEGSITLPPSVGSFAFRYHIDSQFHQSRNRFITWRIQGPSLQLVELSLDLNLAKNTLRLRFPFELLPDVSFYEATDDPNPTQARLYLFVATAGRTCHRLCFDHPQALVQRGSSWSEARFDSVFARLNSVTRPEDTLFATNFARHTAISVMTVVNETTVAFGCVNGSICLLRAGAKGLDERELKEATMMKRLLIGFMPFSRGSAQNAVVALQALRVGGEAFVAALCADSKLRFWSVSRQSLVATADVSVDANVAPRRLQLRSLASSSGNGARVAVAVTMQQRTNCSVFNVACTGPGALVVEPISSHSHAAVTLRDFQLSYTHLWQLWEDAPGHAVVRYLPLASAPAVPPRFTEVAPVSVSDWSDEVATAESADDLLDALFAPGHFTPAAALRALAALGGTAPSPPSAPALREAFRVLLASRASSELAAQKEMWRDCWRTFHAAYREELAPQGLLVHAPSGIVAVINRGGLVFCRPMSSLETIAQVITDDAPAELRPYSATIQERLVRCEVLGADARISRIMSACARLTRQGSGADHLAFEQELLDGGVPHEAAQHLLDRLLTGAGAPGRTEAERRSSAALLSELSDLLNGAGSPAEILAALEQLRQAVFAMQPHEASGTQITEEWLVRLFASTLSEEIVAGGYLQLMNSYYGIIRGAYLLLCLFLRLRSRFRFSSRNTDEIQLLQQTTANFASSLRTLFLMKWLGSQLLLPSDANLARLSSLELDDGAAHHPAFLYVVQAYYSDVRSEVMASFASSKDVYQLLRTGQPMWDLMLPVLRTFVDQLWFERHSLVSILRFFSIILANYDSSLLTQKCIQLLDWQNLPLLYMLAQSYIKDAEFALATACFTKAAFCPLDEVARTFLSEMLRNEAYGVEEASSVDTASDHQLILRYLLRCTQTLGSFKQYEHAIATAFTALEFCSREPATRGVEPLTAALWTNIFLHSLAKRDYVLAYTALVSNTDDLRRRDLLRRLVVALCETHDVATLCSLPFIGLFEDVNALLTDRAAKSDVLGSPCYYDILYALHAHRGNLRKAAECMTVYAKRLAVEARGADTAVLVSQANAYLAAIHAFHLVSTAHAWALDSALPSLPPPSSPDSEDALTASPKRKRNAPAPSLPAPLSETERRVVLQTLEDLERRYLLTKAHIILASRLPDFVPHAPTTDLAASARETLSLLVQHGYFDTALALAKLFFPRDVKALQTVFEAFARRCLLYHDPDAAVSLDEEWADSLEEAHGDRKGGWRLLQRYLLLFDGPDTNYALHLHVAHTLLELEPHAALPLWLVHYLAVAHPGGLLRLYLQFALLEDAARLACRVVDAAHRAVEMRLQSGQWRRPGAACVVHDKDAAGKERRSPAVFVSQEGEQCVARGADGIDVVVTKEQLHPADMTFLPYTFLELVEQRVDERIPRKPDDPALKDPLIQQLIRYGKELRDGLIRYQEATDAFEQSKNPLGKNT